MTKLGLPAGIRACLFDLDGVLTRTAVVHAAAWKQMFDAFLRRARAARPSARSTRPPTTTSTSTAARAPTAYAPSSPPGASNSPRAAPDDPPDAETVHGLGNRKNDARPGEDPRATASRRTRLGALRRGRARRRAAHRGRLLQRQLPRRAASRPASSDLFDVRVDGVVAAERGPRRQAAPGHLPRRPPGTWRRARRGRRLRGRPGRAWTRAAPAASAYVVGVDRVGQADALRAHGADIVVKDLAELLEDRA